MKHGLKQEIKRGLSVLMAASMVASSALPVMAEEVVEEAVEVEVVSEDVADEAGDVVVDVIEADEAEEVVVDGETLEVVTEEAADGASSISCTNGQHNLNELDASKGVTVSWIEADGFDDHRPGSALVAYTCICGASASTTIQFKATGGSASTIKKNSEMTDKVEAIYILDGTASTCDDQFNVSYYAYLKGTDPNAAPTVLDSKNMTLNGAHDYNWETFRVKPDKKTTCIKDGEGTVVCNRCNKEVTVTKLTSNLSATNKSALTAQGHQYKFASAEYNSTYKRVDLTMKCSTCGHTVTVNGEDFMDPAPSGVKDNSTCYAPSAINSYKITVNNDSLKQSLIDKIKKIDTEDTVTAYDDITSFNETVYVKYAMSQATPKAGNENVKFTWDGNTKVDGEPVVVATVQCDTCKGTHYFSSRKAKKVYGSAANATAGTNVLGTTDYAASVTLTKVSESAATCLDNGYVVYTATLTLGDKTYTSEVYAGEKKFEVRTTASGKHHSFSGNVTNETAIQNSHLVKATCKAPGKGDFLCTTCGKTFTLDIAQLGHNFTKKEILAEATCGTDRTYKAYCNTCDEWYKPGTQVANYEHNNLIGYYEYWKNWALSQATSATTATDEANYYGLYNAYDNCEKAAKAVLIDKGSAGHVYTVDEKDIVWSTDKTTATVTFKCQRASGGSHTGCTNTDSHVDSDVSKAVIVKATPIIDTPAGYDTKGSKHYEGVAEFTDCQGNKWTHPVKSTSVEIPATGIKEKAIVTLAEETKTVTYTGDSFDIKATTNSTVTPVVKYYKDAACTQQYKGTPYTAGTYYVKATVKEAEKFTAGESSVSTLVIKKVTPTVNVKASKTSVTYNKKKAQKINLKTTVKVPSAGTPAGKITYSTTSDQIKVKSNGVVTVKKGAKKGTYTVKVKVAKTANYNEVTKTIKIKVK